MTVMGVHQRGRRVPPGGGDRDASDQGPEGPCPSALVRDVEMEKSSVVWTDLVLRWLAGRRWMSHWEVFEGQGTLSTRPVAYRRLVVFNLSSQWCLTHADREARLSSGCKDQVLQGSGIVYREGSRRALILHSRASV